jgi:outer membrane protein OmpA-like peptidoglycan-associated protein
MSGQTRFHFLDSAVIHDNERSKLHSVTSALQLDPQNDLLIEGNSDERGADEYNCYPGEYRALAAREALAKMGFDPKRARTFSHGKDKRLIPAKMKARGRKIAATILSFCIRKQARGFLGCRYHRILTR